MRFTLRLQPYHKPASLSQFAFHRQRAAVGFHKIPRNRQPEPASLHFRSGDTEITVEDAFVIARVDTFAEVLNI